MLILTIDKTNIFKIHTTFEPSVISNFIFSFSLHVGYSMHLSMNKNLDVTVCTGVKKNTEYVKNVMICRLICYINIVNGPYKIGVLILFYIDRGIFFNL